MHNFMLRLFAWTMHRATWPKAKIGFWQVTTFCWYQMQGRSINGDNSHLASPHLFPRTYHYVRIFFDSFEPSFFRSIRLSKLSILRYEFRWMLRIFGPDERRRRTRPFPRSFLCYSAISDLFLIQKISIMWSWIMRRSSHGCRSFFGAWVAW